MGRVTSSPAALQYLHSLGISGRVPLPECTRADEYATSSRDRRRRVGRHAAPVVLLVLMLLLVARAAHGAAAVEPPRYEEEIARVSVLVSGLALLMMSLTLCVVGLVSVQQRPRRFRLRQPTWPSKLPTRTAEELPSPHRDAGPYMVSACPQVWGVGLASIVGPVRAENQDRALAWDQGPFRVVLVADGMGGLPRGGEAAHTVVATLARTLQRQLGKDHFGRAPLDTLRACCEEASAALRFKAALGAGDDGLRSTLIVVISTAQSYYWLFIGDGGLWIQRADGSLESILVPHKDPAIPNVLHASLGPAVHGTPSFGVAPRLGGDTVFVGTDGVFDRIPNPAEFAANIICAARTHFAGDLQRTADEVVAAFAAATDTAGHPICDDNLTLVIAVPDNRDPDDCLVISEAAYA